MASSQGSSSKPKCFSLEEIRKLAEKDGKITVKKKHGVSSVWKDFCVVLVDGIEQNCVQCMKCKKILAHTSGHDGSGTKGMIKHSVMHEKQEKRQKDPKQSSLMGIVAKVVPEGQKNFQKQKLAKAIAIFCALDQRPLSACEGELWEVNPGLLTLWRGKLYNIAR